MLERMSTHDNTLITSDYEYNLTNDLSVSCHNSTIDKPIRHRSILDQHHYVTFISYIDINDILRKRDMNNSCEDDELTIG